MVKNKPGLMSKLVTVLLAFFLIIMLPAGCAKESDKESMLREIGGKPLKKATLSIYLPVSPIEYPYFFGHTLTRKIPDIVEKKLKDTLNIQIRFPNVKLVTTEEGSKAVITGSPINPGLKEDCDIYILNNQSLYGGGIGLSGTGNFNQPANRLLSLYNQGNAKDLTALLPQYAPDYYKQFRPEELEAVTANGMLLAIPSRTLPIVNTRCIVIRSDLVKKYNIKSIRTYEEYEAFMEKVTIGESGITPLILNTPTLDLFAEKYGYIPVRIQSFNGIVYKADDPAKRLIAWEQTPEFKMAVDTVKRWRDKKYFKEYLPISSDDVSSGRYASFIGMTGLAENYNSLLERDKVKEYKYIEFPLDLDYKSPHLFTPYNIFVINPKSPNIERAIMFVEWIMSSQENYDLFAFGIKNEDYTLGKDKIMKLKVNEGHDISDAYANCYRKWGITNTYLDNRNSKAIEEQMKLIYKSGSIKQTENFSLDRNMLDGLLKDCKIKSEFQRRRINIDAEIFRDRLGQESIDEYIESQKPFVEGFLAGLQPLFDKWQEENGKK